MHNNLVAMYGSFPEHATRQVRGTQLVISAWMWLLQQGLLLPLLLPLQLLLKLQPLRTTTTTIIATRTTALPYSAIGR